MLMRLLPNTVLLRQSLHMCTLQVGTFQPAMCKRRLVLGCYAQNWAIAPTDDRGNDPRRHATEAPMSG